MQTNDHAHDVDDIVAKAFVENCSKGILAIVSTLKNIEKVVEKRANERVEPIKQDLLTIVSTLKNIEIVVEKRANERVESIKQVLITIVSTLKNIVLNSGKLAHKIQEIHEAGTESFPT